MTGARDVSPPSRRLASRVGSCLAISMYAGFLLYCVLSLLFGPAGLLAYRRLEARKTAMEANLGGSQGPSAKASMPRSTRSSRTRTGPPSRREAWVTFEKTRRP